MGENSAWPSSNLWNWIGCNARFVGLTVCIATMMNPIIGYFIGPGWGNNPAQYAVFVIAVGTMVFVNRASIEHKKTICLRCSASVPLDPQVEVDRHRRWLQLYHSFCSPKTVICMAGVCVFALSTLFLPSAFQATAMITVLFGVMVLIFVLMRSGTLHRRLQPWCPWCHWGRGDDPDEPPRDPTGPTGRQLTGVAS